MGKRSKDKVGKKERRRVEAAALARSTWLAESAGLTSAAGPSPTPSADARPTRTPERRPVEQLGQDARSISAATPDARPTSAAEAPPAIVDATELAARLASLSTVLQRELGRVDAGDGLTRARLSALSLLVLGGPRTLGELAAGEHVRPPTMTRMVHAMEADGLVVREPHPSDGRSVIIRATRNGEDLLGHGRAHQVGALSRAIGDLDEADRARLADAADLLGQVVRASGRAATHREIGDREMGDRTGDERQRPDRAGRRSRRPAGARHREGCLAGARRCHRGPAPGGHAAARHRAVTHRRGGDAGRVAALADRPGRRHRPARGRHRAAPGASDGLL